MAEENFDYEAAEKKLVDEAAEMERLQKILDEIDPKEKDIKSPAEYTPEVTSSLNAEIRMLYSVLAAQHDKLLEFAREIRDNNKLLGSISFDNLMRSRYIVEVHKWAKNLLDKRHPTLLCDLFEPGKDWEGINLNEKPYSDITDVMKIILQIRRYIFIAMKKVVETYPDVWHIGDLDRLHDAMKIEFLVPMMKERPFDFH